MKKRQKRSGNPNNPLLRRIPRELRKDLGRYIALFLFMSMMIGLVAGFLVADGSMIRAYQDSFTKFDVEDGHFNCDLKLTKTAVRNIEEEDVRLYELFYKDKTMVCKGDQKTVRIYRPRTEVDRADVMEGRLPKKMGEIAVDRLFAENNGLDGGQVLCSPTVITKSTGSGTGSPSCWARNSLRRNMPSQQRECTSIRPAFASS